MNQLSAMLTAWPAWLAFIVSGLVLFNRLIDESEKFASFFGKWGRRMHEKSNRHDRITSVATEFAAAVETAVEDARRKWIADENDALRVLDRRLSAVAEVTDQQRIDLDELRFTARCLTAFTEYEANWHHDFNLLVARETCVTPDLIPNHMDHWQFRALFKTNESWRKWS